MASSLDVLSLDRVVLVVGSFLQSLNPSHNTELFITTCNMARNRQLLDFLVVAYVTHNLTLCYFNYLSRVFLCVWCKLLAASHFSWLQPQVEVAGCEF